MLDELVEEKELDDAEEFDMESESEVLRSFEPESITHDSAMRDHLYVAIQSHVTSIVISNPAPTHYTNEICRELALHVNSLVYAQLISDDYVKPYESDLALELIERYQPVLEAIIETYAGGVVRNTWMTLVEDLKMYIGRVFQWDITPENLIVVNA